MPSTFGMALRDIVKRFIIVACRLKNRQNAEEYLAALTNNDEENYSVFWRFAGACLETLLSVMNEFGHCERDNRLIEMIREIIEVRQNFDVTEEDEGGHVAAFLRRNARERGKRNYDYVFAR